MVFLSTIIYPQYLLLCQFLEKTLKVQQTMDFSQREKKPKLIHYLSYELVLGTNETIRITERRNKTISVHIAERSYFIS